MISGSIAALITPFKENGDIDFDCYGKIIDFHIENGTDGIVVLGTTGEAPTLNDIETEALIGFAVRYTRGRIKVIAGCGSNDTARAKKRCISAENAGADALLLLTPYYNKTNSAGMIKHFTECADSVSTPIIMYNVPARTGCSLTISEIETLKAHDNICGIKEASGSVAFLSQVASLSDENFAVYCGADEINVPSLCVGAVGIISVLANILPRECSDTVRLCREGRVREAVFLARRYAPLVRALFAEPNPIPVKTAMNILNFPEIGAVGGFRLPLAKLGEGAEKLLRTEISALSEDFSRYGANAC